jgi:hypothetical protein
MTTRAHVVGYRPLVVAPPTGATRPFALHAPLDALAIRGNRAVIGTGEQPLEVVAGHGNVV